MLEKLSVQTAIGSIEDPIEQYFALARERYSIYLKREAGEPKPWTDDTIFRKHRFCNVFREYDKTTKWFRTHVRDILRDDPEVLPATVIFRWFNRITTGEAIFCEPDLNDYTAFDHFLEEGDTNLLKKAILSHCGDGPYVTGAYTINTISAGKGLSKVDGVLKLIEMWGDDHDWRPYAEALIENPEPRLQEVAEWLKAACLDTFMTYEIVTDLRHTVLLERAVDLNTWANPGPGATRGLNYINGRDPKQRLNTDQAIDEMQILLEASRDPGLWPSEWPAWELREVEHQLCEHFKYIKVLTGTGQTRGTFDGNEA